MFISDLRLHLENKFVQVFDEFVPLCAHDFQTASFLSNLFWWSEVADKTPEKCGWVYKTAEHLKKELGLTRRGYEKARRILLEKGLVQYRRGGVHGKMHWYINRETLLAKIYELRGVPVPKTDSRYHYDNDNFRLPKFIPLELWQSFLDGVSASGATISIKKKKGWLKQLAGFHERKLDLRPIMEKAVAMGWRNFYALDSKNSNIPSEKTTREQIVYAQRELAEQLAKREEVPKLPPEKPDISRNTDYQEIRAFLKKNIFRSAQ